MATGKTRSFPLHPLIVLLLAGILPFLLDAFFANPATDDFAYSSIARDHGFFRAQMQWYTGWTGRFLSTALMSVNPLVFDNVAAYKVLPVSIIAILFVSMYTFMAAVAGGHLQRKKSLLFSLTLLFLYLDQMPDIRSGLYWMAGTFTYQVGGALLLFLCAAVVKIQDDTYGSTSLKATAAGLALLLPGTNEVLLVLTVLLLLIITAAARMRRGSSDHILIILLLCAAAGGALSFFAPGNRVRIVAEAAGRDLLAATQLSAHMAAKSILLWLGHPLAIVLTVAVIVSIRRNNDLQARLGMVPVTASALLLFGGVWTAFFIPTWSTGFHPAERVQNLIYLLFLTGWMLTAAAFAARMRIDTGRYARRGKRIIIPIAVAYLVLLLCAQRSNLATAIGDLASGRSAGYDAELRRRYALLRGSDTASCVVEPLTSEPPSLFFGDIGYDETSWYNKVYASYFHKRAVTLKPPSERAEETNVRNADCCLTVDLPQKCRAIPDHHR